MCQGSRVGPCNMPTENKAKKVSARPETVREWKDRMEVEHRTRYNQMERTLNCIKINCAFAVANADQPIRQFAKIMLSIIEGEESYD
jgi:hypothetical protein